jgi:hypothetical protein
MLFRAYGNLHGIFPEPVNVVTWRLILETRRIQPLVHEVGELLGKRGVLFYQLRPMSLEKGADLCTSRSRHGVIEIDMVV